MKYKLLKDLPGLKAGAIFESEFDQYICDYGDDDRYSFPEDTVEASAEWFESILEDQLAAEFEDCFRGSKLVYPHSYIGVANFIRKKVDVMIENIKTEIKVKIGFPNIDVEINCIKIIDGQKKKAGF